MGVYTYKVVSTSPVDGAAELVGLVETAIAIPVENASPFGNDTLDPAPAGSPFWKSRTVVAPIVPGVVVVLYRNT